jgi:recombination protein RecA
MNAPAFSDPWTTSGGKAIAFHASTRIRLSLIGKIQDGNKNVIGVNVKAVVVKNRLGPPHRVAEFDIYFDRGIDDFGSWLDVLKDNGLVKQSGAWYTMIDETTGEEVKFQSKDFPKFLESNVTRKEAVYNKICDALIMKYRSEYNPDEHTLDTGESDTKELLLD